MKLALALPVVAAALSLAGCGPTLVGEYPHGQVAVAVLTSGPPGWFQVDEPGWLIASMPAAPTTTFETIEMQGARVQVKALSATDQKTVFTWLRYFEVSTLKTMLDRAALLEAGKANFLGIQGVHFLRDEPRRDGVQLDFLCDVDPHSPLAPSDRPMVAHVRAFGREGTTMRITFAIAVFPADGTPDAANAFFDELRIAG
jgi:hypothetical protein